MKRQPTRPESNSRHQHPTAPPRVSVIIPTFNRAWTVAEAIDSALDQRFASFEVIVVDDGSTDRTQEVLTRFGSDIRTLKQANAGVSAARNAGIRAAAGELIALLDSDDLWRPDKLAHQVAFFDSHPDCLICQCREIWIRNGRRVNPKHRHRKSSGDIFLPSLELCLVSPSAVMMRRSLFDEIGYFDETLPACEDYDLWLQVSARFPVALIDFEGTVKRGGHPDQLSRAPGLDRYRIRALEKIIAGDRLTAAQKAAAVATLKRKCTIYAGGCRKRNRLSEARHYERLARAHDEPAPDRIPK
jgi:glycosyltransferase involved in cell wall biosynthesis